MASAITVKFEGDAAAQFRSLAGVISGRVGRALIESMQKAANVIEITGRADIAAGGNFGARWTQGLHATFSGSGFSTLKIEVTHDVPYWSVFQTGKTIFPRNGQYLWLPISGTSAVGKRPREVSGLVSFHKSKAGNPLMGVSGEGPLFVGVSQVTLKKRFHLLEVVEHVAKEIPKFFEEAMASNSGGEGHE